MSMHVNKDCAKISIALLCLFLTMLLLSCETMYYGGLPKGDPASGYGITGYIGASPGSPCSRRWRSCWRAR